MKVRFLVAPFVLLTAILFLAACGLAEPAPTLPPPPTLAADGKPPAIVVDGGTAVADSSPTPLQTTPMETPTLAPTATATALPDPVINPAQMPAISHDLLFVGQGKLKRWQRDGQVVTLLSGDVVDYSLSADGKRAIVAQLVAATEISNTVTAVTETIKTFALNEVNLETDGSEMMIPAANSHRPLAFQLSPDGKHLAFSAFGLGEPTSLVLTEKPTTGLYVMALESGLPPVKVRDCAGVCSGLVWHQDNNFFVFGDDEGLFLYNLAAKAPERLTGGERQHFQPLSWAKNGRWLMLLFSENIEGASTAIFDVPTKRLMEIPHTFFYAGPYYPQLTWMADDRIFLTRLEGIDRGPVLGETYRVVPEEGRVQLDEQVVLTAETMQSLAPKHWQNGRFGYGLYADGRPENGFYQRIAFNEPAERLFAMPLIAPDEIVWTPDGSGAIMTGGGGMAYGVVGGELLDLETAVGLRGQNFTWLP